MDRRDAARRYRNRTLALFAIYGVLCFASPWVIERFALTGPAAFAAAIAPAAPIAFWLKSLGGFLRCLDEFQLSVQLRAFASTLGVLIALATAWGFLVEYAGYPQFPLFLTLPAAVAVWAASSWLAKRPYA